MFALRHGFILLADTNKVLADARKRAEKVSDISLPSSGKFLSPRLPTR
jgi:hypothetical protein